MNAILVYNAWKMNNNGILTMPKDEYITSNKNIMNMDIMKVSSSRFVECVIKMRSVYSV